ncbi:MAG: cobalamin biosynthesis protein CobD [Clostridia bacterium]|nr:cobalamin biosynthesis protein CobD [Clostridia bacterium]MBQ4193975.1 cobalamin biosynthesis protein CobD [Clostridia bacterium]MBQ4351084.1 cobalamin biosynthesis protein CobD [Clostridia bacterium]
MRERILWQTAALVCGFIIDFFVGDPYSIPHPVVAIGKWISFFDRRLRRGNSNPKDVGRGALTVILVALLSTLPPALLLDLAWHLHPILYFVLNSVMCWQILAARQLFREGKKVQRALEAGDTEGARYAVSMIVGRDTDVLDEAGICRAAVETVAENTSDGVIAPLCWILLFGAAGGFFYKSINTMDSMLGYKNEKYLYFGRAAAKTDDVVNWIPARLSGLLLVLCAPLCRLDGKNAWRIFRRDRYKHASPNSAQSESAAAGALRVRLAGDAVYGGVVHKKEFLGDPLREIEPMDITRTGRLMYAASLVTLILGALLRVLVALCF